MTAGSLDRQARVLLSEVADQLIPAADGMPSASAVGVAEHLLDEVLTHRPDLAVPLAEALATLSQCASSDLMRMIACLQRSDPAAHDALITSVAGAYYLSTEVRRRLRYQGQEALQISFVLAPAYVFEGLLDPVLERGPLYRDPSAQQRESQ